MRMKQALAGAIAVLAGALMPFGPVSRAAAEQPPTAAAKAVPAFEKLKGRWLRDTGGYIIEIRSVGPGGKLEASYFNPRSIHVGTAEASQQGGVVKVSVELRRELPGFDVHPDLRCEERSARGSLLPGRRWRDLRRVLREAEDLTGASTGAAPGR